MEIVAEFTYNHFGDINRAKRMIVEAKKAGATCVKFELRNNDNYYRNNSEIRNRRSKYEFSGEQISEFVAHCKKVNIGWFASVHDIDSLKKIIPFHPKYIKIASREARSFEFLKKVVEINKKKFPIIISTGALTFTQIKKIALLMRYERLTFLHTSCLYPSDIDDLNMNRIKKMKELFDCKIGYSGHEEGFIPSLYACFLGVDYIERHFTLEEKNNRVAKGKKSFKDYLCTLSPIIFAEMVASIKAIEQMKIQKLKKSINPKELERVNTYGKLQWDGEDLFLK